MPLTFESTDLATKLNTFSGLRWDTADSNSAFWFILFVIIVMLGQYILMPMVTIFCTLTYHGHEEEEEGTALKSKIDEIGLNN